MIRHMHGDCREVLKTLPENSVHCVVTSPPYYGLRSYGIGTENGEIGLEESPQQYVDTMVAVFREVRRVIRDDGTVFLNIGDTYAANRSYQITDNKHCDVGNSSAMRVPVGLKPKDLMMIPARVALALQEDGWWIRSEIVWCKKSSMPESVTDRPTSATEKIFLLTKSARYFYDAEAVKEPSKCVGVIVKTNGNKGMDKGYDGHRTRDGLRRGVTVAESRNLRNFWLLGPDPYPGAHFATMPRRIPEIAIMAGTSEAGCCAECGSPYQRIVEKGLTAHDGQTQTIYPKGTTSNRLALLRQAARERGEEYRNESRTIGWQPACTCNAPSRPCTVLDPFGGSGTTGMVAEQLGRDAILIELNPDYIALQKQRTAQPAFSFLEPA